MPNKYREDSAWANKKLTPSQLAIHDISFVQRWPNRAARLELNAILPSLLIPEDGFFNSRAVRTRLNAGSKAISDLNFSSAIEEKRLLDHFDSYGWMSELRLDDEDDDTHCRWIHVPSKFPENLKGILTGMSDWTNNPYEKAEAIKELTLCIQDQERFSKHGKTFAPFFTSLGTSRHDAGSTTTIEPILMSIPFMDWSVHPDKEPPPLRFQLDEKENQHFAKSAMHPLRSLLQYYYRLEDTSERERHQVFAKHRPWNTDRDTDLRVRRWYGHYPASIIVDELWILVIDERHIVSFSANQSWKSRWPPLQLSSRIAEVSFRTMRDSFNIKDDKTRYSSILQVVACLHGAAGLMHRSFWTDQPLPCTERYGGYLSHLQYRIYRSPSTRLVMDLLQTQDELNICQYITQKQLEIISEFKQFLVRLSARSSQPINSAPSPLVSRESTWPGISPSATLTAQSDMPHSRFGGEQTMSKSETTSGILSEHEPAQPAPDRSINDNTTTIKQHPHPPPPPPFPSGLTNEPFPLSISLCISSISSLSTTLSHSLTDLTDLHSNTNNLLTRTIQLVNIRMEDHGQAILVFTVVTVIFLPLSFIASFFGMNTIDIRTLPDTQWVFWASGLTLTAVVVVASVVLAFYGGRIREGWVEWRSSSSFFTSGADGSSSSYGFGERRGNQERPQKWRWLLGTNKRSQTRGLRTNDVMLGPSEREKAKVLDVLRESMGFGKR